MPTRVIRMISLNILLFYSSVGPLPPLSMKSPIRCLSFTFLPEANHFHSVAPARPLAEGRVRSPVAVGTSMFRSPRVRHTLS